MNCRILRSLDSNPAPYLSYRNMFFMSKIIAQIRLSTKHLTRFCIKGEIYRLEQNTLCTLCNLQENETLEHFIFVCPIYSAARNHYLRIPMTIFEQNRSLILQSTDPQILKSVYYFILNSLKIRSFILNE